MSKVARGTGDEPSKRDDFQFFSQLKRAMRKITTDIAAHAALADPHTQYAKESDTAFNAPSTPDYLVGTAQAGLSAEIVVGATPGGELGGTWGVPTVAASHSGSTHAATQTAAEATAAAALAAKKLDELAAPTDVTTLDASTTTHGLLRKLDNDATHRLDGQGAWVAYTVRAAAAVPSGAPTGTELPIAVDTTAVTGGVYYWTGAAWVLAASI